MKRFAIALLIIFTACSSNIEFDSDLWNRDKSTRSKQIKNLTKSEILINKSFDEVIELLGEFDLDYRNGYASMNNDSFIISYITGNCNWIDFERLEITIVTNSVTNARINCD